MMRHVSVSCVTLLALSTIIIAAEPAKTRTYENRLTRLVDPKPLLADHPEFVEPVRELTRYEDPIRKKLYRSFRGKPTEDDRRVGAKELDAKLKAFSYRGQPIPAALNLSRDKPVVDYFRQFSGLDAGPRFNNAGFWDLPIPL